MIKTISLFCPKCGIIKKSGKRSCCGRGGSWFGNCGAAGKVKLSHKWSDGLEACITRSRSKKVVSNGQQPHAAPKESNHSYKHTDWAKSQVVITRKTFTSELVSTSDQRLATESVLTPTTMRISPSIHTTIITSTHTVISTALSTNALAGSVHSKVISAAMIAMYNNMSTLPVWSANASYTVSRTFIANGLNGVLMTQRSVSRSNSVLRFGQSCYVIFRIVLFTVTLC